LIVDAIYRVVAYAALLDAGGEHKTSDGLMEKCSFITDMFKSTGSGPGHFPVFLHARDP